MDSQILKSEHQDWWSPEKTLIEQDRENRACNIILYNVQEPKTSSQEERWREDREFCLTLFNKILGVPTKEEDIKKFVRLGKMNSAPGEKYKTCFNSNMIMESLGKLKQADEIFKKVPFTHDMAAEDREEYKRLVTEEKDKENDDSGEFMNRVKGAPGNFRVLKIHKRN